MQCEDDVRFIRTRVDGLHWERIFLKDGRLSLSFPKKIPYRPFFYLKFQHTYSRILMHKENIMSIEPNESVIRGLKAKLVYESCNLICTPADRCTCDQEKIEAAIA